MLDRWVVFFFIKILFFFFFFILKPITHWSNHAILYILSYWWCYSFAKLYINTLTLNIFVCLPVFSFSRCCFFYCNGRLFPRNIVNYPTQIRNQNKRKRIRLNLLHWKCFKMSTKCFFRGRNSLTVCERGRTGENQQPHITK